MSLSTLLEAAKYLDFLDSNANKQHQHQQQLQQLQNQHQHQLQLQAGQPQTLTRKKSIGRQRSNSKKNAVMAMSLPSSSGVNGPSGTGKVITQSVPIPVMSTNHHSHHHAAHSLSSSFTTGSPSSASASTALLCPKASNMMSASSSSAASSLSSSDSSSSCGEILMGESYYSSNNSSFISGNNNKAISKKHIISDNGSNNHVYHITHQQHFDSNNHHQQIGDNINNMQQQSSPVTQFAISDIGSNKAVTRYIATTSSGPHLVTMRAEPSTSIPIEGSNLHAGHVIQAFGSRMPNGHYSMSEGQGARLKGPDGQTYVTSGQFTMGENINGSPTSSGPLIMARVQPMILNSMGHSAQTIMAFQQASASSPTSSSYSRHRELHKTLEKNRRAHLRHCFELLKSELPSSECVDKKTSHINIIKTAIKYALALQEQEASIDAELQRLTKTKNELTESLAKLSLDNNQNQAHPSSSCSITTTAESMKLDTKSSFDANPNNNTNNAITQPPAAEQQLSFLLSQSKID